MIHPWCPRGGGVEGGGVEKLKAEMWMDALGDCPPGPYPRLDPWLYVAGATVFTRRHGEGGRWKQETEQGLFLRLFCDSPGALSPSEGSSVMEKDWWDAEWRGSETHRLLLCRINLDLCHYQGPTDSPSAAHNLFSRHTARTSSASKSIE